MSAARNKRRRHAKRGRFGFLYKMLAVIALAAALIVGATVFFRVETVVVEGNVRYESDQIVQASEVIQGDNLFALNKYETARRIRRLLPYVEGVSIRRNLPDTLVITVQECRAVAWLSGSEDDWLISKAGKVLESVPEGGTSALHLEGLEIAQPEAGSPLTVAESYELRYAGVLALLSALEQSEMTGRVTRIDLSSPSRIIMDLDGRFTVRLPVSGDFSYLLSLMSRAAATLEPYETGTLDLTVADYDVVFSPA